MIIPAFRFDAVCASMRCSNPLMTAIHNMNYRSLTEAAIYTCSGFIMNTKMTAVCVFPLEMAFMRYTAENPAIFAARLAQIPILKANLRSVVSSRRTSFVRAASLLLTRQATTLALILYLPHRTFGV